MGRRSCIAVATVAVAILWGCTINYPEPGPGPGPTPTPPDRELTEQGRLARAAAAGFVSDLAEIAENMAHEIERDSLSEAEVYERLEEAVDRARHRRWHELALTTNEAMANGWDGRKMATMLRERAAGYRSIQP